MNDEAVQYLDKGDYRLAYIRQPGAGPTVVFLGGYCSDMTGTKAAALRDHCRAGNRAILCFDYRGHGQSGGDFNQCGISDWRDDALAVIDELSEGPLVLVGSSMGGWIMLLVALARRQRIKGLVGVAAAPDFTEDVLRALSNTQQQELQKNGLIHVGCDYDDDPYPVTRRLLEDGRNNLLLNAPIRLNCPVRLLQGMQDQDVPWQNATRIMENLESNDAHLQLLKNSGHRLSEPHELGLLMGAVDELSA